MIIKDKITGFSVFSTNLTIILMPDLIKKTCFFYYPLMLPL